MTTELTNYDFEGHEVRTALVDGEPWFVAKDVAEVLGYANPADAISKHCNWYKASSSETSGELSYKKHEFFRIIVRFFLTGVTIMVE